MNSIDNMKGITVIGVGSADPIETEMVDTVIWGETEVPDGSVCSDKIGLMLSGATNGFKPIHPTMSSSLPIFKLKSDAAWGGY